MLQMEGCSHQILKARTAKVWELESRSLGALQLFVALHSNWFRDIVIIDGSYINAAFVNRRLAGQHGGWLVTGEVQTQLHKDKQGSKDEQRGKETGVEEANESDKPSESSGLDRLFMSTV